MIFFFSHFSQVCRCDKKTEFENIEKCGEDYVEACPERWEIQDGAKVWVPDTSKCVNLKQTKCQTQQIRKEDGETKCDQKPEESCKCVHERIPKQKEMFVPYMKCGNNGYQRMTENQIRQYGIEPPKNYNSPRYENEYESPRY